ncbi:MAG: hypothetical protein GXP16_01735 [Gammaproteobacteria bacterium]|nr:hypothetical protein [Gammaproteobacteria bacterium]
MSQGHQKDVPFDGESEQQFEFDQQEQAINDQIEIGTNESIQVAIDLTIDLYNIDTGKVEGVLYDSKYGGSGRAKYDCMCVVIGDQALVNARVLGSTLGHEVEAHINNQMYGRSRGPSRRSRAYAQHEIDAYSFEINSQWRFRYSNEYRDKLIGMRNYWQRRATNAPY